MTTYQDHNFRALLTDGDEVICTRILRDTDGTMSVVTTLGRTIPSQRIVTVKR